MPDDVSIAWMFLAMIVLIGWFVMLSPKAKRRLGIWLIAHADAHEQRKVYLMERQADLKIMVSAPMLGSLREDEDESKVVGIRR